MVPYTIEHLKRCSGMRLDSRIDLIADLGVDLKIAVLLNETFRVGI